MRKAATLLLLMFPEVRLFEREEESTSAWDRAYLGHGLRAWIVAILWLLLFAFGGLFVNVLDVVFRGLLPGITPLASKICSGVAFLGILVGGGWFLLWLLRGRIRQSLRLSLVACGVPVCLHCSYDVRGQIEPRCPECGHDFDPKLRELWETLRATQPDPNPRLAKAPLTEHLTTDN